MDTSNQIKWLNLFLLFWSLLVSSSGLLFYFTFKLSTVKSKIQHLIDTLSWISFFFWSLSGL